MYNVQYGKCILPSPHKTYVRCLEFFAIVDARYPGLAITDGRIVADTRRQHAILYGKAKYLNK